MTHLKELVSHVNNPLLEVINDAHANYCMWWQLRNAKSDKEKRAAMNSYVLFFGYSMRSFLLALIISLYKLFDKKLTKTNNLSRLIRVARKEPKLPAQTLEQVEELARRATVIWKKVEILRNGYFAHLRFDLDEKLLWQEAKVTPDELQELIGLSLEIFNKIRYNCGEGELSLISFEETINRLLSRLST